MKIKLREINKSYNQSYKQKKNWKSEIRGFFHVLLSRDNQIQFETSDWKGIL